MESAHRGWNANEAGHVKGTRQKGQNSELTMEVFVTCSVEYVTKISIFRPYYEFRPILHGCTSSLFSSLPTLACAVWQCLDTGGSARKRTGPGSEDQVSRPLSLVDLDLAYLFLLLPQFCSYEKKNSEQKKIFDVSSLLKFSIFFFSFFFVF